MMHSTDIVTLLAFGLPGHTEWLVILVIGLLLFGRRLPEVGRSVGRTIVEFKKGIKGVEDEIDQASTPKQVSQGSSAESLPGDERTVSKSDEVDGSQGDRTAYNA
ncbi:MAG: twin-arginine translocase TatA/TatE family subunit [Planctomycetota bacterium]